MLANRQFHLRSALSQSPTLSFLSFPFLLFRFLSVRRSICYLTRLLSPTKYEIFAWHTHNCYFHFSLLLRSFDQLNVGPYWFDFLSVLSIAVLFSFHFSARTPARSRSSRRPQSRLDSPQFFHLRRHLCLLALSVHFRLFTLLHHPYFTFPNKLFAVSLFSSFFLSRPTAFKIGRHFEGIRISALHVSRTFGHRHRLEDHALNMQSQIRPMMTNTRLLTGTVSSDFDLDAILIDIIGWPVTLCLNSKHPKAPVSACSSHLSAFKTHVFR